MSAVLHDSHVTAWGEWRHEQARHFLNRLDPEANGFTFQSFDDTQEKRRELARVTHGDFDRLARKLDGMQNLHAGIFVTVNETDGKGRQAHNVRRVRAVFVDLDGAPLRPILEAGIEPHIVCESSPGKYHAYWLVADCPLDQFGRVQRALARRFGGDPSVHDLSRVMRLPGFRHFKAETQTSRLLDGIGAASPPYTLAEIVVGLRLELDPPNVTTPAQTNGDGGKIAPGGRHLHLFASGRSMAARKLSREAVRAALAAENQARCDPPLPDVDIDYLAERAFAAKPGQSWKAPGNDDGDAGTKGKGPRLPRVWLDDAPANIDADYIIKGLIERGRLSLIFGPSGDGKTFFAVDLCGHIACGLPWRGRRVHRGLVVYVAAEAGVSILRRFYAWQDHYLSEAREDRTPLAIITRAVNLLNLVEVAELIEELRAIAVEAGLPLALVVFDTLSRSIAGGDENSPEDMTRAIAAADAIRDELGAAVAIIHHSGKDSSKGSRGHSSLYAAADAVVSVIERVATVDKSRDGTQGDVFPFALDIVELGTDSDGDTCTTCLVRHLAGEAAAGGAKRKKITASAQVALDALKAAIDAHGEAIPATSVLPRVRAVTVAKWQDAYARIRPMQQDLTPDETKRERNARRMAFRRAQDELQAARVAGTEAGFWWLN